MKKTVYLILLVFVLAACQSAPAAQPTATPTATVPPATPTPRAELRLTQSMLENAAYHSVDWGDFQLQDGFFYRTPPAPGESPQLYCSQIIMPVYGDLNADGWQDAVVILQTRNGGNGDHKELAVLLDQDGKAGNVSTVYLGSRIGVGEIRVQAGIIALEMRVLGPNDALCCPSQLETWQFKLENNQLVRLP